MKRKHEKEIIRWAKSPEGTKVWFKLHDYDDKWRLEESRVKWSEDVDYVVNDDYATIRKAQIDGKIIESTINSLNDYGCSWGDPKKDPNVVWTDIHSKKPNFWDWSVPVHCFRIKEEKPLTIIEALEALSNGKILHNKIENQVDIMMRDSKLLGLYVGAKTYEDMQMNWNYFFANEWYEGSSE